MKIENKRQPGFRLLFGESLTTAEAQNRGRITYTTLDRLCKGIQQTGNPENRKLNVRSSYFRILGFPVKYGVGR
jgi:hypothetical protein